MYSRSSGTAVAELADLGAISIECHRLSKKYRLFGSSLDRLKESLHPLGKVYHSEFWAVRDVDLVVRPGEIIGILGRNGSGKSTLLRLITGVLRPTGGSVSLSGRVAAILELGAGFNPDLTGRRNVEFFCQVHGLDAAETRVRLPEIFEFADIGNFLDQPVKTYSSGMFVRLAFAAAISVDPEILIVDEALAVGDARFQLKCYQRLAEFQRQGKTILFVTHDLEAVPRICNRGLVMDHGYVVFDGGPVEAVHRFKQVMFGAVPAEPVAHAVESQPPDKTSTLKTFGEFLPRGGTLDERPYYNCGESRFGNGGARIIDVAIMSGGQMTLGVVGFGEVLDILVRVKFEVDVVIPVYGLSLRNKNGVEIFGTTSRWKGIEVAAASAGSETLVHWRFTVKLNGGDLFLEVGIAGATPTDSLDGGDWTMYDVRQGVIHLTVINAPRFIGLVDVPVFFGERRKG